MTNSCTQTRLVIMAEGASSSLFMRLLFLLTICTSEVSTQKQFISKEKELKEKIINYSPRLFHNQHYKTAQHVTLYPPTNTFPTTPATVSPVNNPAPTIITVPSTIPGWAPVTVPSTNPMNLPVSVTNPVTTPSTIPGAQGTNPVTTYPAPSTAVPSTPLATNSVPPPSTTGSSSAVPGQSWCVVKSGSGGSSLQAALDYACGIGGADCSGIQQGSSCYNPNSLQNHASYAFNSYYQKNPVQTSCDFRGTAMITNINPSTGTCIYPSSSSPSSSPMTTIPATTTPTPTITTPTPTTTTPAPITTTAAPTTTSSSGATVPVFGPPPAVLNTSNPGSGSTTGFGESPPSFDSSTSMAIILQPFLGCIILIISVVTGRLILDK